MSTIPSIVLTGGPCAGKTSALATLAEWLPQVGFKPILVPEAATQFFSSGFPPGSLRGGNQETQDFILRLARHNEDLYREAAHRLDTSLQPVLICDRGICDAWAYLEEGQFAALLAPHKLSLVAVRDARYTGIIHLRTTALGAESFYTTSNNTVRREGIEDARAIDHRTLEAWIGHPHVAVIENEPGKDFAHKLHQVKQAIARILGIPEPLEIERKYLVAPQFLLKDIPAPSVAIDIEQAYLPNKERIRRQGQHGEWVYFHTIKHTLRPGVRSEVERIITRSEYDSLFAGRDRLLHVIRKTRVCFVHARHYCELDIFLDHNDGLVMLEIETHDEHESVSVPPYVPISKDVTHDPSYTNVALARR